MGMITPLHGFSMALADSVPGVSGGTVAFILGFYDKFIGALHDLFSRDRAARRRPWAIFCGWALAGQSAWGCACRCWQVCSPCISTL